ncbi:MAG: DUF4160 domain-containing protein [Bacteroidota bacterium]
MPLIDSINGLKIYVYSNDHNPPHFHAKYGEYEVQIVIKSGKVWAGYLPGKQKRMILKWLSLHSNRVLKMFYVLNPNLR